MHVTGPGRALWQRIVAFYGVYRNFLTQILNEVTTNLIMLLNVYLYFGVVPSLTSKSCFAAHQRQVVGLNSDPARPDNQKFGLV